MYFGVQILLCTLALSAIANIAIEDYHDCSRKEPDDVFLGVYNCWQVICQTYLDIVMKTYKTLRQLHCVHSYFITSISKDFISIQPSSELSVVEITYCSIHTVSKDAFSNYPNLQRLNLEFNRITNLEFVFNLLELRELFVNNNRLTQITAETFTNLKKLKILNVANNGLITIGDSSYNYMEEFYLNNNNIVQINSKVFQNLNDLKILNLSHNKIKLITKHLFDELKNLEELYLQENQIKFNEPFSTLPALKILNMSSNNLVKISSDSFAKLNNLQLLVLSENAIEDFPLGTFKHFPLLRDLQLGLNRLSKFKLGSFSNLANLKLLNLSHNNLVTLDETTLFTLHSLNELVLDNNMISVINYTSLLDHLLKLNSININNNNWNCNFLLNMLKYFKSRNVHYLHNVTGKFTEENIDGISCNELEENAEEYTTSLNPLITDDISSSTKYVNNINNDTLKNIRCTIAEDSKENNSFFGHTFPVYSMLICCIAVVFLIGFNIYKKYYKTPLIRNDNGPSDMVLIDTTY